MGIVDLILKTVCNNIIYYIVSFLILCSLLILLILEHRKSKIPHTEGKIRRFRGSIGGTNFMQPKPKPKKIPPAVLYLVIIALIILPGILTGSLSIHELLNNIMNFFSLIKLHIEETYPR